MRKPILLLALLLCLQALSAQSSSHALLVAVGDYPAYTGWAPLQAVNDTRLLREALRSQGFSPDNIHTLTDAEATRERILQAIYTQLTLRVRPGDVAIFHFSGHGQQLQDDNGDEIDGLDEALVPYNSPKRPQPGINYGQYLLRDDELGEALRVLRQRLGPQGHLLVLLDACHSGTATRGPAEVARGTDIIMAEPDYLASLQENPPAEAAVSDWSGQAGGLSPVVVLSGSSPHQSSYECQGCPQPAGLFSLAFARILSRLPSDATYRSLLAAIRQEVGLRTSRQTPLGEGALDMLVLGGGVQPGTPHFSVKTIMTPSYIQIEAGELEGCTQGSIVALYPAGVTDTVGVPPLSFGYVSNAGPFLSDISLDRQLPTEQLQLAKVFLRERNYGPLRVTLSLRLQNINLQEQLQAALSAFPFVVLTPGQADLSLEEGVSPAGQPLLQLFQYDGRLLWQVPLDSYWNPDSRARQLAAAIADYARADFLRQLETYSPLVQAQLLVLVSDGQGSFLPLPDRPLRLGESIKLEVVNRGDVPFYFSILDIQPNHKINKVVPGILPAADFSLRPYARWQSEAFLVGEPEGIEVLKLVATPQPVDFNFTRSSRAGGNKPLDVLLGSLFEDEPGTRSAQQAIPADSGQISTLMLRIVR
jgi:metacaspase-1